jgi:phosphomethylpyrimidine synthase
VPSCSSPAAPGVRQRVRWPALRATGAIACGLRNGLRSDSVDPTFPRESDWGYAARISQSLGAPNRPEDALLLVEVQRDFCAGGALPVPDGDRVVDVLNAWVDEQDGKVARAPQAAMVEQLLQATVDRHRPFGPHEHSVHEVRPREAEALLADGSALMGQQRRVTAEQLGDSVDGGHHEALGSRLAFAKSAMRAVAGPHRVWGRPRTSQGGHGLYDRVADRRLCRMAEPSDANVRRHSVPNAKQGSRDNDVIALEKHAMDPWTLPLRGAANPSSRAEGTGPGSFALAPNVGGPRAYASPDTRGMPQPSAKTAWDFLPPGWRREATVAIPPEGFHPVTQLDHARLGIVTEPMRRIAEREPHLTPEQVRIEVAAGRMIIPANKVHLRRQLDPTAIGRASRTKVNANLGASPVSSDPQEEVEKLRWAERWGADTVMDLSTGGDLDRCREAVVGNSHVPVGTVPIYSMIVGRRVEELSEQTILDGLRHQAEQGVDYFTVHAGILREHLPLVERRLIGIVSRGGSLLAKWMLHRGCQNPMFTLFDEICDIMREYDIAFSLGDGLRPGGLADASDAAQFAELETLAGLTERAWRKGCQVMVEGPGHVPFDQIEYNMKLERALCHGAPFYVLGPLVTDVFPGYDHITSAIGATAAAFHGASMLCYVTPKEHLGLPKKDDVKQGCVAYRIAAHAADVALGIPHSRDWDDALTKARAALHWEKHFELSFDPDTARALHDEDLAVDTDFCAMCGHDWCAVRISKEIAEFDSGKAAGYERGPARSSPALTAEQSAVLLGRGVLRPEQIHQLAGKTRRAVGAASGTKPGCHSDLAGADAARSFQDQRLGPHTVSADTPDAHD